MLSGRYTLEQWEGTPRRALVSFFIWFDAANSRRAPLMYRPGSHRVVAGDSWFASVMTVEQLAEKGLYFLGDVKTGTSRFVRINGSTPAILAPSS